MWAASINFFSLVHLCLIPLLQPFSWCQRVSSLAFYSWTLHWTATQSASFLSPGSQPHLGFKPGLILSSTPSLLSYLAPHLLPLLTACSVLIFSVPPLPESCCHFLPSLVWVQELFFLPVSLSLSSPAVQMGNFSSLFAPNLGSGFPHCTIKWSHLL